MDRSQLTRIVVSRYLMAFIRPGGDILHTRRHAELLAGLGFPGHLVRVDAGRHDLFDQKRPGAA